MKNFTQVENTSLYKSDATGRYYRLTCAGVTPNMCWLIVPKLLEVLDIDIATGTDIYGNSVYHLGEGCVAGQTKAQTVRS
jgi:hypothetical protein